MVCIPIIPRGGGIWDEERGWGKESPGKEKSGCWIRLETEGSRAARVNADGILGASRRPSVSPSFPSSRESVSPSIHKRLVVGVGGCVVVVHRSVIYRGAGITAISISRVFLGGPSGRGPHAVGCPLHKNSNSLSPSLSPPRTFPMTTHSPVPRTYDGTNTEETFSNISQSSRRIPAAVPNQR